MARPCDTSATIDGTTAVHAVDRKTGAYRLVRDRLPSPIVGAGVSTCAPLLEQPPEPDRPPDPAADAVRGLHRSLSGARDR